MNADAEKDTKSIMAGFAELTIATGLAVHTTATPRPDLAIFPRNAIIGTGVNRVHRIARALLEMEPGCALGNGCESQFLSIIGQTVQLAADSGRQFALSAPLHEFK